MAEAAALVERLLARDAFLGHLGIRLLEAGQGRASLAMRVRPEHVNFNGTCHGGVIFALADGAFGLASNSRGVLAAGIDAHITYPAAAYEGDELTATAHEVARSRRIATYRVDVTNGDGRPVAAFTGTVYVTERAHGNG